MGKKMKARVEALRKASAFLDNVVTIAKVNGKEVPTEFTLAVRTGIQTGIDLAVLACEGELDGEETADISCGSIDAAMERFLHLIGCDSKEKKGHEKEEGGSSEETTEKRDTLFNKAADAIFKPCTFEFVGTMVNSDD